MTKGKIKGTTNYLSTISTASETLIPFNINWQKINIFYETIISRIGLIRQKLILKKI